MAAALVVIGLVANAHAQRTDREPPGVAAVVSVNRAALYSGVLGGSITPAQTVSVTVSDPPSGGQSWNVLTGVQYSIDSGPLQPVVYGGARSDIVAAFPGFSNSAAAGGHAIIDWSALPPGPHAIGWFITDDCGRADGIGSLFFSVASTSSQLALRESSLAAAGGRRNTRAKPTARNRSWSPEGSENCPNGSLPPIWSRAGLR